MQILTSNKSNLRNMENCCKRQPLEDLSLGVFKGRQFAQWVNTRGLDSSVSVGILVPSPTATFFTCKIEISLVFISESS